MQKGLPRSGERRKDRPGAAAEFERDLIRARAGEGRARAVARGQKMPTAQTDAAPEA